MSNLGYGEELAIFERPIVDAGVEKVRWIEHRPVNQISQDSAIEFQVSGSGSQYVDLRRTYLYVKAKIVQLDGSDLPAPRRDETTSKMQDVVRVGPVNLFLHTLFSQIDVYLQDKLVTSSNSNYYQKAYIDTILQCCPASRLANFQAQLYYEDTPGELDETDPFAGTNRGLMYREYYTRGSRSVDMQGPLYVDVFQISRYLLNGISVKMRFWPTRPALHLMSDSPTDEYRTVIEEAVLKVCHITPTPHMLTAHQAILSKNNLALYPYLKSDIKKFTVSKGAYDFTQDDVFQNLIPTRLIICMVENEALSGSYKKNPFNFQHFNVNFVEVSVDGESVPSRALQTKFRPSYADSNYISAYLSMSRSTLLGQEEHSITRVQYHRGYTFFCFDLEPEISQDKSDEDDFWPAVKHGNLRVEMHFDQGLSDTISVLMYGTFPKTIKIDHTRAVILD